MKRKAKIAAVPPASIEDHKATKQATLTEIETLRIRAEVARLRELDATVANLRTQLGQASIALQQQNAKCAGMRNQILQSYGFDPASTEYDVIDEGSQIVVKQKSA